MKLTHIACLPQFDAEQFQVQGFEKLLFVFRWASDPVALLSCEWPSEIIGADPHDGAPQCRCPSIKTR